MNIAAPAMLLRAGVAAVAAMLAWAALLAGAPAGIAWLCGADGLVPSVAAWDAGRLATLSAMWLVMMTAMVMPCVAFAALLRISPHPHPESLLAMLGSIAAGALLHWSLESTALLGGAGTIAVLLAVIALLELRKWTAPSRLAPLGQMIALQLLVDPMSPGWMAVVTLWMLADALMPERAAMLRRLHFALAA